MLPPAVAVQPEPTPPPAPPAKAGAEREAPAEPAGLLDGNDAVAGDGGGDDEDGSEAGVLGVPKPAPLLPANVVTI